MGRGLGIALVAVLALAGAVAAQDAEVNQSPVLTIDSERVFASSNVGQNMTQDLESALAALVAENRQIEADLNAEEQELTRKRPGMASAEFRTLADAFDVKVRRIRAEQDAKERELQVRREAERQNFINVIAPILTSIGRERGAIVILERRSVILSADSADITEEVISRINASRSTEDAPESPANDGETAAPEAQ